MMSVVDTAPGAVIVSPLPVGLPATLSQLALVGLLIIQPGAALLLVSPLGHVIVPSCATYAVLSPPSSESLFFSSTHAPSSKTPQHKVPGLIATTVLLEPPPC